MCTSVVDNSDALVVIWMVILACVSRLHGATYASSHTELTDWSHLEGGNFVHDAPVDATVVQ